MLADGKIRAFLREIVEKGGLETTVQFTRGGESIVADIEWAQKIGRKDSVMFRFVVAGRSAIPPCPV